MERWVGLGAVQFGVGRVGMGVRVELGDVDVLVGAVLEAHLGEHALG